MTPTNLAEYYQSKGQALPSVQERAPLYSQYGGTGDYKGTDEQNTFLLGKLVGTTPQSQQTSTITPVKGSGTYAEDLAKSFDQIKNTIATQGITDNSGKVLVSPGQYNEQTNQISTSDKNASTGANNANQNASKSVVGTSDAERAKIRADEIAKIKEELTPETTQPTLYKSSEEFKKLREEQGVVDDENELASIRNEAALGKEELRQYGATAGEGVSEGGRLGMMDEKTRNLNFKLEGLALRESAVVDRLNSKNSYIKTVLDLGQQDYNTAKKEYDDEYSKNLQATQLFNQGASEEKQDAITGLTTITNLLKDKGITIDNMDATTKTQIETLSLKAGLPSGLIEQVIATAPEDKIQTVNARTDASGNEYFDTLMIRPDGSMYVQSISRGSGGGGSGTTIKSGGLIIPESTVSVGQQKLDQARGSDGYTNSALYLQMLKAWKDDGGLEQDFFTNYPPKNYLNPNDASVPSYIRDKLKASNDREL